MSTSILSDGNWEKVIHVEQLYTGKTYVLKNAQKGIHYEQN